MLGSGPRGDLRQFYDDEKIERELACMALLRDCIVQHQSPFTTLGCGRTGLRYKWQRVAWSMRLDFHSHFELAECFRNTKVILKDAGTERALARIQDIGAGSTLPHFDPGSQQVAQRGEQDWPEQIDDDQLLQPQRALGVDGPAHMVHGLTEDLAKPMKFWEFTVLGLKHVCRLLRKAGPRGRMLQRCFNTRAGKELHGVFANFRGWGEGGPEKVTVALSSWLLLLF